MKSWPADEKRHMAFWNQVICGRLLVAHKRDNIGAGERIWWAKRALADLWEEQSQIPASILGGSQPPVTSAPGDLKSFSIPKKKKSLWIAKARKRYGLDKVSD
jgi:hypothetical protein